MLFSLEKTCRSKMSVDPPCIRFKEQGHVAMGRKMILTYPSKSRRPHPLNHSLAVHIT